MCYVQTGQIMNTWMLLRSVYSNIIRFTVTYYTQNTMCTKLRHYISVLQGFGGLIRLFVKPVMV